MPADTARPSITRESRPPPLGAVGLGLAGALAGAAVWTVISITAKYEVGYVAVLVGFLAGRGVRLGARGTVGKGLRGTAVALAVLGLASARYGIFAWLVAQHESVSPLDSRILPAFAQNLGNLFTPYDLLWVFLAMTAAWRAAVPPQAAPAPAAPPPAH